MRKRIDPKPILLSALKGEAIPPGRKMGLVYCRIIVARHHREQGKTQEEVGACLGKDRATISYYDRKYDMEYKYNPEFRELADWFNQMKEQL